MKLNDPSLLARYMADRDINGAKLARKAGMTRQFVYQLLGGTRHRCSDERAAALEEALGLLPGTIFHSVDSTTQAGVRATSAA